MPTPSEASSLDLDALLSPEPLGSRGPFMRPQEESPARLEARAFFLDGRYPTRGRGPDGLPQKIDPSTPEYAEAWTEWMMRRRRKPGV